MIAERATLTGERGQAPTVVAKTSEARVYPRRPRARHDVGAEPLDWFRIGIVLTVVLLASGGGLTVAGLLRQGPLRDIGWTDRRLEGFAMERAPKTSYVIGVGAAVPASSCTLEVTVEVVETRKEVLLGPVRGREPRLPLTAPECADGGARENGRVYGVARLSAPVGDRNVLDARTRQKVEVVQPRAERTPAADVPPQRTPTATATPATSATPAASATTR
jgi:hypothetical protein